MHLFIEETERENKRKLIRYHITINIVNEPASRKHQPEYLTAMLMT